MDRAQLVKALRDTAQSASNAIAGSVSGPVDLITAALRVGGLNIEKPIGGSEWMNEKGLTIPVEMGAPRIVGETLGMAGPAVVAAKAPQIASAMNRGVQNLAAPTSLNRQAGVVSFQTGKNLERPTKDFSAVIPEHPSLKRQMSHFSNLADNFDVSIYKTQNGNFAATYSPASHLSKNKSFVAQGDDLNELVEALRARLAASDRGVRASVTRASRNDPLSALKNEYGDVFDLKKSERSASQYITHKPSGTKIRISDHPLPMQYDQPDINLPVTATPQDVVDALRRYFGE